MTVKSRSSGRAGARLLRFSMFAVSQKIGMGEEQAAAMSNKQRLIGSLGEGRRAPTFEVRQLKFAPGWYVRVLWQYGQEQHVSGFASADEAQSWVHRKSEGWLRNRTAALRGV
jgi:hypothetical protein